MDLPSGRTVTRSMLQAEARVLIALGPDAVPHLLPIVMNDNPALRYVAIYTLEQITGEKPYLPYFDQTDHEENRTRAIEVWRRWYEERKKSAGSAFD
ncbi:MAG TPA: HEAT repeat domain-containing protein [Sedimentisphaerales bacterium]|nr:HEAT repeat domain-containing protein [Sedimentisphaerales bacterium]